MSEIGSSDLIGRAPGGRKLIAVVYADMVGYSRLIGLDDLGTLERLRTLRSNLIDPAINEQGGKIVQTGGDSLLIAFDSIDGAVRCAVKMQQLVSDYDGDEPADQAIRFRIGINIGDVIADGTDLHGEGVNVAARLQAQCPPGGICVSRAVRDHVHGRLGLVFSELGALSLKNVTRPVEAFLLRLEPEPTEPRLLSPSPAPHLSARRPKLPRYSLVVAQLRDLGVATEHQYLCESIAEDIATFMLQYWGPAIIGPAEAAGRHSDFLTPRDIARDLGMAYVIQGSIRGIDDRLSVSMHLIDTETGVRLWSERFDLDRGSTAEACEEITHRVAAAFSTRLWQDVNRRIEALPPQEWTAEDFVMRGWTVLSRPPASQTNVDANRREAMECFRQALARDALSSYAKLGVAQVLILNGADDGFDFTGQNALNAEQAIVEVLRAGEENAFVAEIACAHQMMGTLRRLQGRLADALVEFRVATGLISNSAEIDAGLGKTLLLLGQPEAAMFYFKKSLRMYPQGYFASDSYCSLGLCYLVLHNTEMAITSLRTARAIHRWIYGTHWLLAAALGLQGAMEEARAALQQALEIRPDVVSQVTELLRRGSPEFVALFEKTVYVGLRRAGLPDMWAESNERPLGWTGLSDVRGRSASVTWTNGRQRHSDAS
jgi:adenylate cyclase